MVADKGRSCWEAAMKGPALAVFVSYRRSDVSGYAGRITDTLVAALGAENVFQDVAAVTPGADFHVQIDRSLAASDVVLAVIGVGWLEATTRDGRQRLFQDDDWVRIELAHALTSGLRVVPVLVGGAVLPKADQLPDDLRDLVRRQAVALRDESFHQDLDRLLRSLRGEPTDLGPASSRPRSRTAIAAAGLVAVLLASGATWWRIHDPGGSGGGSSEPTGCPDPSNGTDWHRLSLAPRPATDLSYGSAGSLTFTVNAASWRLEQSGHWQVVLSVAMLNSTSTSREHAYYYYEDLRVARRPFGIYCFDPPATMAAPQEVVDARVGFDVTCTPAGAMSVVVQNAPVDVEVLAFTQDTVPANCGL
jgi:hypothetical protein